MKSLFVRLLTRIRRTLWAFIVAYMLGLHNFYKGEDKSPDSIAKIEIIEQKRDGEPGDDFGF